MEGSIVETTPKIRALLARLHSENTKQESSLQRKWYQLTVLVCCLWKWKSREDWDRYNDLHCTNQLLSHSPEKCELMYMLACLNNSKSIVECGTSFGVSTIYFALAASRNALSSRADAFGVLTIEKDANKFKKAKSIWAEAGPEINDWIFPFEGDLLEVLQNDDILPKTIDLLFLDAWTSLAFPALKFLLPRLREGSLVFADKTSTGSVLYRDLLDFVHDRENGFMNMTIPFTDGFEVMVRKPMPLDLD